MTAHRNDRSTLEVVEIEAEAAKIVDLRDVSASAALGIELADAVAPCQDVAASGGAPPSWGVRDRLVEAGAQGLIDPLRKRPGLRHLVLFRWNDVDAPIVRVAQTRGKAAT